MANPQNPFWICVPGACPDSSGSVASNKIETSSFSKHTSQLLSVSYDQSSLHLPRNSALPKFVIGACKSPGCFILMMSWLLENPGEKANI